MEPRPDLLSHAATRLAGLSACLFLGACMNPVCDETFGECPASIGPDAGLARRADAALDGGSTDGGRAPDATTGPDASPRCVPSPWEFETVTTLDTEGWPGASVHFVLDSDDAVHLTYSDGTSRYYRRRSSSGWSAPMLLGEGFSTPPKGTVTVAAPGVVLATWGDELAEGYPIYVGELLPDSGWSHTIPEPCLGHSCSCARLASDAAGVTHLSFVTRTEPGLVPPRLLYASRSPGKPWSKPEFVEGVSASQVAIAVGPDGPHFAYNDSSQQAIKHVARVNGAWKTETVEGNSPAIPPTLSVDDAGGVHIGFLKEANAVSRHVYAHRSPAGSWAVEEVGVGPGPRLGSSFVTTHEGRVLLGLQTDSFVGVSRRTAQGWQTERVAEIHNDTLSHDSGPVLRVGSRGEFHLVYPDWGEGKLMYARRCPAP